MSSDKYKYDINSELDDFIASSGSMRKGGQNIKKKDKSTTVYTSKHVRLSINKSASK